MLERNSSTQPCSKKEYECTDYITKVKGDSRILGHRMAGSTENVPEILTVLYSRANYSLSRSAINSTCVSPWHMSANNATFHIRWYSRGLPATSAKSIYQSVQMIFIDGASDPPTELCNGTCKPNEVGIRDELPRVPRVATS